MASSIGNKLLRAAHAHYVAKKEGAEAKLSVYLSNPVGVGEHPDIPAVVVELVSEIEHSNGCLNVLDGIMKPPSEDPSDQLG
jgi:hypothetical protein